MRTNALRPSLLCFRETLLHNSHIYRDQNLFACFSLLTITNTENFAEDARAVPICTLAYVIARKLTRASSVQQKLAKVWRAGLWLLLCSRKPQRPQTTAHM